MLATRARTNGSDTNTMIMTMNLTERKTLSSMFNLIGNVRVSGEGTVTALLERNLPLALKSTDRRKKQPRFVNYPRVSNSGRSWLARAISRAAPSVNTLRALKT